MKILVFSDRDGTINRDENYYLGSKECWKEQVSFLEGVITGIKLINTIPNTHFFILTNQSGVALGGKEFDNLTEGRLAEVNQYIIDQLDKRGARVDHVFSCPYVDNKYVEKAKSKERLVNSVYVQDNHPDMKPNTGMIKKALQLLNLDPLDCKIYVIGDRYSDVQMGINAGGTGILVESFKKKELGDKEKVEELSGEIHIAENFLKAAEYIKNNNPNNTNL